MDTVDFIERQSNLLSKKECDDLINWSLNSRPIDNPLNYDKSQYSYVDFSYDEIFTLFELKPIKNAILQLISSYNQKYPELDELHSWRLDYLRIKWWKPGDYYSVWHSEHTIDSKHHGTKNSLRVLSFLIYLSDNDSYTEFTRYGKFETKSGCGIIFPAYFTHTHRGSPCKKGLDKYMASGYFSFIDRTKSH